MTKKVNYFSHDYSARNDAKIISLRRKTGMEGLGIFWALVEMLYENGGELSVDDENLENLAYEWRCEVETIKIVIFECGLFVVENGKFFSKSVNERLKKIDESRERKSEAGKKGMEKRWQKNNTSYNTVITDVIKNDNTVIKNDNTTITENNKEINKKINKNTLNPLTSSEVCEESPISEKTSDEKSVKSVFFKKFFEKFPKKTHENEAEITFLNLNEAEIKEISKVFPFWLEYWKTIDQNYVPNAYSWLFNKSWRNKIPEKNGNFVSEKPSKIQPIPDNFPKDFDEKNRLKETEEREKFLKIFGEFSPEKQAEITAKLEQKFANTPVKKGDHLWKISLAEIVKSTQKTDIF